MNIELNYLKAWYCKERQKLEELPAFQREAAIALNKVRQKILIALAREVDMTELKSLYGNEPRFKTFFESPTIAVSINEIIDQITQSEQQALDHEKEELSLFSSNEEEHTEYALYFYQLAKVNKIEEELKKKIKDIDPDQIYQEFLSGNTSR